ncbi:hypothetical protein GQ42DRAFT_165166 [Ramicandelaber brevisporus]|nr:hypothetical protein GQ42DRAFT_165166 [Ramicandelaber brevisporus]
MNPNHPLGLPGTGSASDYASFFGNPSAAAGGGGGPRHGHGHHGRQGPSSAAAVAAAAAAAGGGGGGGGMYLTGHTSLQQQQQHSSMMMMHQAIMMQPQQQHHGAGAGAGAGAGVGGGGGGSMPRAENMPMVSMHNPSAVGSHSSATSSSGHRLLHNQPHHGSKPPRSGPSGHHHHQQQQASSHYVQSSSTLSVAAASSSSARHMPQSGPPQSSHRSTNVDSPAHYNNRHSESTQSQVVQLPPGDPIPAVAYKWKPVDHLISLYSTDDRTLPLQDQPPQQPQDQHQYQYGYNSAAMAAMGGMTAMQRAYPDVYHTSPTRAEFALTERALRHGHVDTVAISGESVPNFDMVMDRLIDSQAVTRIGQFAADIIKGQRALSNINGSVTFGNQKDTTSISTPLHSSWQQQQQTPYRVLNMSVEQRTQWLNTLADCNGRGDDAAKMLADGVPAGLTLESLPAVMRDHGLTPDRFAMLVKVYGSIEVQRRIQQVQQQQQQQQPNTGITSKVIKKCADDVMDGWSRTVGKMLESVLSSIPRAPIQLLKTHSNVPSGSASTQQQQQPQQQQQQQQPPPSNTSKRKQPSSKADANKQAPPVIQEDLTVLRERHQQERQKWSQCFSQLIKAIIHLFDIGLIDQRVILGHISRIVSGQAAAFSDISVCTPFILQLVCDFAPYIMRTRHIARNCIEALLRKFMLALGHLPSSPSINGSTTVSPMPQMASQIAKVLVMLLTRQHYPSLGDDFYVSPQLWTQFGDVIQTELASRSSNSLQFVADVKQRLEKCKLRVKRLERHDLVNVKPPLDATVRRRLDILLDDVSDSNTLSALSGMLGGQHSMGAASDTIDVMLKWCLESTSLADSSKRAFVIRRVLQGWLTSLPASSNSHLAVLDMLSVQLDSIIKASSHSIDSVPIIAMTIANLSRADLVSPARMVRRLIARGEMDASFRQSAQSSSSSNSSQWYRELTSMIPDTNHNGFGRLQQSVIGPIIQQSLSISVQSLAESIASELPFLVAFSLASPPPNSASLTPTFSSITTAASLSQRTLTHPLRDSDPTTLSCSMFRPLSDTYVDCYSAPVDLSSISCKNPAVWSTILNEWLQPCVKQFVVKPVDVNSNNWKILTQPGAPLLNPRQTSFILNLYSQSAGLSEDMLDVAHWIIHNSTSSHVISIAALSLVRHRNIWRSLASLQQTAVSSMLGDMRTRLASLVAAKHFPFGLYTLLMSLSSDPSDAAVHLLELDSSKADAQQSNKGSTVLCLGSPKLASPVPTAASVPSTKVGKQAFSGNFTSLALLPGQLINNCSPVPADALMDSLHSAIATAVDGILNNPSRPFYTVCDGSEQTQQSFTELYWNIFAALQEHWNATMCTSATSPASATTAAAAAEMTRRLDVYAILAEQVSQVARIQLIKSQQSLTVHDTVIYGAIQGVASQLIQNAMQQQYGAATLPLDQQIECLASFTTILAARGVVSFGSLVGIAIDALAGVSEIIGEPSAPLMVVTTLPAIALAIMRQLLIKSSDKSGGLHLCSYDADSLDILRSLFLDSASNVKRIVEFLKCASVLRSKLSSDPTSSLAARIDAWFESLAAHPATIELTSSLKRFARDIAIVFLTPHFDIGSDAPNGGGGGRLCLSNLLQRLFDIGSLDDILTARANSGNSTDDFALLELFTAINLVTSESGSSSGDDATVLTGTESLTAEGIQPAPWVKVFIKHIVQHLEQAQPESRLPLCRYICTIIKDMDVRFAFVLFEVLINSQLQRFEGSNGYFTSGDSGVSMELLTAQLTFRFASELIQSDAHNLAQYCPILSNTLDRLYTHFSSNSACHSAVCVFPSGLIAALMPVIMSESVVTSIASMVKWLELVGSHLLHSSASSSSLQFERLLDLLAVLIDSKPKTLSVKQLMPLSEMVAAAKSRLDVRDLARVQALMPYDSYDAHLALISGSTDGLLNPMPFDISVPSSTSTLISVGQKNVAALVKLGTKRLFDSDDCEFTHSLSSTKFIRVVADHIQHVNRKSQLQQQRDGRSKSVSRSPHVAATADAQVQSILNSLSSTNANRVAADALFTATMQPSTTTTAAETASLGRNGSNNSLIEEGEIP